MKSGGENTFKNYSRSEAKMLANEVTLSRNLYTKESRQLMRVMAACCLASITETTAIEEKDAKTLLKSLVQFFRKKELACFASPERLCYDRITRHAKTNFGLPESFYSSFNNEFDGTTISDTNNYETKLNTAYNSKTKVTLYNFYIQIIQNNLIRYLRHLYLELVAEADKAQLVSTTHSNSEPAYHTSFDDETSKQLLNIREHDKYATFVETFFPEIDNNTNKRALFSIRSLQSSINTMGNNPKKADLKGLLKKITVLINILFPAADTKNLTSADLKETNLNNDLDRLLTLFKNEKKSLEQARSNSGTLLGKRTEGQKVCQFIETLTAQFKQQFPEILNTPTTTIAMQNADPKQGETQDRASMTKEKAKKIAQKPLISSMLYCEGGMLNGGTIGISAIRKLTAESLFKIEKKVGYKLSDAHRDALAIALVNLYKSNEIPDLFYGSNCYNKVSNTTCQAQNFTFPFEDFFNSFTGNYYTEFFIQNRSATTVTQERIATAVRSAYDQTLHNDLKSFGKKIIQNNLGRYLRHLTLALVERAEKIISKPESTTLDLNVKKDEMKNFESEYQTFHNIFSKTIQDISSWNNPKHTSSQNAPKDKTLSKLLAKIDTVTQLITANNNGNNRLSMICDGAPGQQTTTRESMLEVAPSSETSKTVRETLSAGRTAGGKISSFIGIKPTEGEQAYTFLQEFMTQFPEITQLEQTQPKMTRSGIWSGGLIAGDPEARATTRPTT